ncbi:Lon protease family protein [Dechloromonas denitrificans]|uniref:Lon protease family protein n=1 Tax=Dechloromonas denitrificans TaxID=281362 RepID=UPI001CF8FBD5|nr:ATP-binding protein [Dechloromonas denitrificans]UCV01725.1 AAA family ATPase [Dechloromonas denitrificans]
MPARFLEPNQLYTPSSLDDLSFTSTSELSDLDETFCQARAVEALRFGLGMRHGGFNLFVLGEIGSSRHELVRRLVEEVRQKDVAQFDYCYVNNFQATDTPRLLLLPAGRGSRLRDDMQQMAANLGPAIAAAFESEEYRARTAALEESFKLRQERALSELGDELLGRGVALMRMPEGFALTPVKEGTKETLSKEEFEQLPDERKHELAHIIKECQVPLGQLLGQFPRWRREQHEAFKEIGREAIRSAAGHLFEDIRAAYLDLPDVLAFLATVEADVIETGDPLSDGRPEDPDSDTLRFTSTISVQRYQVNLLVDNAGSKGQPVVFENLPTFPNLVGRVEHEAHMGALFSNFTLIRAGALHRANGGYLVLDASKLLSQPYAWEGLKRALQTGQVAIESIGDIYGVISTLRLQPEPIPLKVKVVLIGEPILYYLLAELDPEFAGLFKVAADFEVHIPRSAANSSLLARHLATQARQSGLKPLTRAALERVIEHAARLTEDAERLSVLTSELLDLMQEADFHAGNAELLDRTHVEQALAARTRRADRLREHVYEAIQRDILLIATTGGLVGQINGLATVMLAGFLFAHPVRLSAAVCIGDGEMIDIEREIEMGGPIHSKGVMILAGFFSARFGRGMPLSFNASIVFEQTYGEVEGDSASLAELCALLSAISAVPIRQNWAVTGSVNQYGAVQPIGAVNEKIEGFFDICAARGLTGEQGVIIPASNVKDLMLKPAVVEAVAARRFRVAAVDHVDQAIELLTGLPAGDADAKGVIPEGSMNYLVATHLLELHSLKHLPSEEEEKSKPKRTLHPKKAALKPPPKGKKKP